ncbi:MAG: beta-lactamase family protein [Acidobacteriales bacterium]|nr:beta-lactamase family protein [Terriglobales bacterium]
MRQSGPLPNRAIGLKTVPTSLSLNLDGQQSRFQPVFQLVEQAIAERAFPAASLSVAFGGELVCLNGFGRSTYDANTARVKPETIFDVASLTKPVATTAMAMMLYERSLLDLDLPAATVVPELTSRDSRSQQITLRSLLTHSSGLPAHARLYEAAKGEEVFRAACRLPLNATPGTRAEYSDIGYIVLGKALERLANEELDGFCKREIFGPLGMTRTMFRPPAAIRSSIPPTRADSQQGPIQGTVDDENASAMGGIAGHAGLFSNAGDLAIFANCLLKGGSPVFRPDVVDLFTSRQRLPGESSWALGWDTPTTPSQSGTYLSPRSYGHLGFTGTSLWIDPDRQLAITLLTNRTWPDRRSQAIKQVRPALHDAIVRALDLT